jgi:uncharacterized protein YndB with AHSA1/START domain
MADRAKLRLERIIDAAPADVFRVWTTREAMEHWYRDGDGYEARVIALDLRVGGEYRIEFGPLGEAPFVEHGRYLEVDPPRRLVMTEALEGVPSPWSETRVTVELHEANGKTLVVLTHEDFPSSEHRDLAAGGWPGFLDRIEALLS